MEIGVVFPQSEIGSDPAVIRDFAQAVEALGYSHLLTYDHVLGAHPDREPRLIGPYTHETSFHEPFVLFGFLAAHTQRIGLVTGIIILPQRQTALVAKQAAEVDILSGGRLRLGIGTGWNYVEYDALNEDFHNRGKRQEEQVTLLRKLWAEPVVDFTGKWHRIDRAGLKPLPNRRIPIWFGGNNEQVFKRAARLGDGLIPQFLPNDAGRATLERIDGYLASHGRSRAEFGIEAQVNFGAGPEKWASHVDAWRVLGANYVCVRTMNAGLETPQEHIEAIRRYKAEVG
ncbi:MAG: LLM class F420-dependent oxidoreductase [Dehalococcoidia bacterium]|uniref:LLM class F420-dependent oxidoreductase n=1 Tax=Candidatus Amarobacter glycogenicus TaxID=3140699 RepID=UPI003135CAF9|nr:LLM class F420-dependent oxidoreductase [Dehalococcoidia bacterium]MBK7328253.1 LLM class F420-dependent oxidoreductase [Dehalococcoidia bacterium]